jgi:ABC-type sugar transport system ATPase subunit
MCTSYNGLPQGSVLSPFMYMAFLHRMCSILQYADDLVVFVSGKHVGAARDCLQASLTRLMSWFEDLGLSLSAKKSGFDATQSYCTTEYL